MRLVWNRVRSQIERTNTELVRAARGAAAAYCSRTLVGRQREVLTSALTRWRVAAVESEAEDRLYAVEERARQQLMLQAQSFHERLDLLDLPA